MSGRVSDNLSRVRDILKRKSTLTFEDLKSLVRNLKGEKSFGDTRKLLQYAKQYPNIQDHSDWIAQQLALCTYKDQDLHDEIKFDSAMSILQKSVDLAGTQDPETLGIAGAIHKYKWDALGQKQDLETALAYYMKGHEADVKQGYPRLGYPGINAAYVLDCLASTEENEAQRLGYLAPDAQRDYDSARKIRRDLVDKLVPLSTADDALLQDWWYLVTVAEGYFGLGEYESAGKWLALARDLPKKDEWEVESTARQLAGIARMTIGSVVVEEQLSGHPSWKVLARFLGNDLAGVRSAFIGKVGLALSGGGFRASLFHIGVLARLAELDVLRHVEVLSCVSGGSILGAYYYLEVQRLLETKADSQISQQDYIDIVQRLERHFLKGVQRNIRTRVFANPIKNLKMVVSPGYTRTHRAGELYEKELYSRIEDGKGAAPRYMHKLIVHPLNDDGTKNEEFRPKFHNWRRAAKVPVLVLNSTSLNTGHLWQFTATWMGEPSGDINAAIDSNDRLRRMYYDEAPSEHKEMRLGYAVGSSACVPGVFTPLRLKNLYPDRDVLLVDGGVHDNQGTASLLEQGCTVVLVSDASGQMDSQAHPSAGLVGVPLRSNSIMMSRVRQAQFRELAARQRSGRIRGLMFLHLKLDLDIESVDWIGEQSPEDPVKPEPMTNYGLPKELQGKLAGSRTDLDSFSDVEAFALMTSGYRMAKHEFGKNIKGVAKGSNEVCWQFQSIEPAIDPEADTYASVLKILKVAHLAAAKIWVLSKALQRTGGVVALFVAVLLVCLAIRYSDIPLLTVGMVGSALVATGVAALLGKTVFKILWWRETFLRSAAGVILGLVGWMIPMLHLSVFDRLFLRRGSIERILKTSARKSAHSE